MIGASPRLGSSQSSSFGWLIIALAMASICCSPPDSDPAFWSLPLGQPGERLVPVAEVGVAASP